jgi:hypothetical protein
MLYYPIIIFPHFLIFVSFICNIQDSWIFFMWKLNSLHVNGDPISKKELALHVNGDNWEKNMKGAYRWNTTDTLSVIASTW